MENIKKYLEENKINFNMFTSSLELFVYLYPEMNFIIYFKLDKYYVQSRETNKVKTYKTSEEVIEYLDNLIEK